MWPMNGMQPADEMWPMNETQPADETQQVKEGEDLVWQKS